MACWLSVSICYLFSTAWEKPMSISHVCLKKKKSSIAEHAHFLFMPAEENERTVIVKRCIIQSFWTHLATQTSWPCSSLAKIRELSLARVNYSVWFNRKYSSLSFIALFATIGAYTVRLVMAVINCSFPLLLHEPARSAFRHKRLIAITASCARKRRPLFFSLPFPLSKTCNEVDNNRKQTGLFFQSGSFRPPPPPKKTILPSHTRNRGRCVCRHITSLELNNCTKLETGKKSPVHKLCESVCTFCSNSVKNKTVG